MGSDWKSGARRFGACILVFALFLILLSACTPIQAPPAMVPPMEYQNPVYRLDFPDPFVLYVNGHYYAYATNARGLHIQVLKSADLVNWKEAGVRGEALPQLPAWAEESKSFTWAPSVLARNDQFVLYYTTRLAAAERQCISYAVSNSPEGPFVDSSETPFVCQLEEGGSIDPEPFVDRDGALYLLWKNDGNCCGFPIYIYAQPLSEDGLRLLGEPVRLIAYDQEWETPLIENPSMVAHEGKYYLIYSGNWWESRNYAVGYAICETPLGPCVKPQNEPVLASAGRHVGPGGASFFRDAGGTLWIAYHAWREPYVGYPAGMRRLYLAQVDFDAGKPVFRRPEAEP